MTRVNLIDPNYLADQHLLAEIRELPRCITYVEKTILKGSYPDIPERYTLGAGHIKFFFDKVEFLRKRQIDLVYAWYKRGFSLSFDIDKWEERCNKVPSTLRKDYTPDSEELMINVLRIKERMMQKPSFYKYWGDPVTFFELGVDVHCKKL